MPRFTSAEAAAGTVKRELAAAIGMIRRAEIGERHNTIVRAAAHTAGLVKAGWLTEQGWRQGLTDAALEVAPNGPPEKIEAALDWALQCVSTPGEEFDHVS